MGARPCMNCGAPLDFEDNCATPFCPYNPQTENKQHEAEVELGEHEHTDGQLEDDLGQDPHGGDGGPELSEEEMAELLNDEEDLPDTKDLAGDFEDDEVGESDKMDLSQEDLPGDDLDEGKEAPKDDSENEPEDEKGSLDELPEDLPEQEPDSEGDGDLDEMTPEQKDKLNEQGDHDPSDDAEDEDSDLPPRPQGCNGDCQPGDQYDDDAVPCPHCTAKQFKEQMESEGKQNLPEDQMEQEMQQFLDNWQQEADQDGNGQGDQGDEEVPEDHQEQDKQERRMEQEQRREEQRETPPDPDDEDLPPRPDGCNGDCQPGDDPDGIPCPHCTTKQFRDKMKEEENLNELDEEELSDFWQDFLDNWEDQKEEKLDEPESEQKNPEEIDEEPPEEELKDGDEPKDEKDDEPEEKGEFKRVAKDMTVTQEKRFDNLVERLEKKVEQMFGQTAEDMWLAEKQDGQFQGEEVSQSVQITSRGVTYWVTISAAKQM